MDPPYRWQMQLFFTSATAGIKAYLVDDLDRHPEEGHVENGTKYTEERTRIVEEKLAHATPLNPSKGQVAHHGLRWYPRRRWVNFDETAAADLRRETGHHVCDRERPERNHVPDRKQQALVLMFIQSVPTAVHVCIHQIEDPLSAVALSNL